MIAPRSARITVEILEGKEILIRGHETARRLWNFTWWCVVGYNRKLQRRREGKVFIEFENKKGEKVEYYGYLGLKGKLPPYAGKFTMQKELKDHWAAVELSDRCFSYTVREFDIAMRSWFSNLKINPRAKPPGYREKPRQLTFEVGRNAKPLGDWTYRLTVLGGSGPDRHALVKIHVRPGVKMRDIKLIRVKPGGSGSIVYYVQEKARLGIVNALAGIDLGINNIAAVAFSDGTSILYSGRAILDSDRYYHKLAARCKPSGWHKGMKQDRHSERRRNYEGKSGDMRRLAIHNVTRSIVDECIQRGVGTIVMGDLKGIRNGKDHGKVGNQKLHAWPFAEILRQVTYKAKEVGIEVVTVSERNTSKTCHMCGVIGKRVKRGLFICQDCNIEINADINGAFNILNKVSPAPAYAGVGVGAVLPGPPSPRLSEGTGKAQISPTFAARFDLRNWAIVQTRCNRQKAESFYVILPEIVGVAMGDFSDERL